MRAYEHGRRLPLDRLERLGAAREPVRQDVHRGARAHADAAGRPVGLDPVRRAAHQGRRSRSRWPRCWRWRPRTRTTGSARCSSPTRSSGSIPPRKGRRHALRVIRDLVAFEPAGRRTNLAASLSYASRLLRHRSIVVILSDFIAEGWERPLRRLAARHEVVAITVDDPREHELPESGWIEMLDAESGRRVLVDTGSREVRTRVGELAAAAARGARPHAGRRRAPTRSTSDRRAVRAAAPARVRPPRAADQPGMMALGSGRLAAQSRVADGRRHDLGGADGRGAAGHHAARPRTGMPRIPSSAWARRASPHVATRPTIAYPIVVWRAGRPHGRGSRAAAPERRRTSRLAGAARGDPADRRACFRPCPRTRRSPRSRAPTSCRARAPTPIPLLVLLGGDVVLLAPLHWWWRRRGGPQPASGARRHRRADEPPLERWADDG